MMKIQREVTVTYTLTEQEDATVRAALEFFYQGTSNQAAADLLIVGGRPRTVLTVDLVGADLVPRGKVPLPADADDPRRLEATKIAATWGEGEMKLAVPESQLPPLGADERELLQQRELPPRRRKTV